jgi:heterodisulfide reductase subunit A
VTRTGVFLCECGGNISGVLDLPALAARGRALEGVVDVQVCQFLCGSQGRRLIEGQVSSRGLDRIVIGACSRRFQGPTFERIARDLDLGENTVAFANLREGCAFIHRHEPERAQRKAETVLAASVARAARQRPLQPSRTFLHRSALVVGGGIGGLSAAEELAASGIEVHLVEREQSLGGYMARLSKTFPTEDCAMCSLGPRLANAATDARIHVDTLSEVTALSGPPGEFRARVLHRPRFVSDQCVGCGACAATCPVELESEFDLGVTSRTAISRPFANAVPATFAIDHRGWAPCTSTCPAHTSAQGYIALAAQGRWAEAYRVASAPNPFPSVCGRICPHACEDECTRGRLDEPVAIAGIKRFVADRVGAAPPLQVPPVRFDERVAVVGSGPAGLTAARDLALLGYPVTVFEAEPVAGGMLRLGVPEYRLPREVIASEVERVLAHGVELRCGQRCGRDFTVESLLASGYRAVLLALGLQRSRALVLPGSELRGVVGGVDLLRSRALGNSPAVGRRVVVVGGGDVAVDAARTALRLGAERVTIACIEDRGTLPAHPSEIIDALEEGVELAPALMPVALLGDGAVTGVRLRPCSLGEPDARGWRPPLPVDGDPVELEADTVVLCVGQSLEAGALEGSAGVAVRSGQIVVDPGTMMTARAGVFAAGDAAPAGALIAIEAVAAGARAARSIHNHLRGEELLEVWPVQRARVAVTDLELTRRPSRPRQEMAALPPEERRRSWREVRPGFSEAEAVAEARRCLSCGGCAECGSCEAACPAGAIDLRQRPWEEELTVGAVVIATGHREFDARRKPPLGFGRYANVLTQSQLARLLAASGPTAGELRRPSDGQVPRRVFMLQCVGSRDSTSRGNSHCSAICCLFATLHASLIRESYPDTQVTVAYTDLRMPGKGHEEYLRLVAERGVRYVRSRVGEISEDGDGSLRVRWEDTLTRRKHEELFDLVVLSVGLEASEGTAQIARVAGLQQGAAGFLKEYHPKLRPVDSQRSGIFIAGTAQGPKGIPETIAQAKAAAARVISMLEGGMAVTPVEVAFSDPGVCIGCGVCVNVCPQGAVRLLDGDRPHAVVDQASCRGCGICAAECPSGAMTVGGFSDAELLAEAGA